MLDLSQSSTHIALTVDGLRAADHLAILGRWPSLVIVTARASLQLDLVGDDPSVVTGRLLHQVANWDRTIRRMFTTGAPGRLGSLTPSPADPRRSSVP